MYTLALLSRETANTLYSFFSTLALPVGSVFFLGLVGGEHDQQLFLYIRSETEKIRPERKEAANATRTSLLPPSSLVRLTFYSMRCQFSF
jgi:hypothetical protein